MRLSQQSKNAVSVLAYLARAPERARTVAEIAAACGITEYNAFKLVPLLVKGGCLRTIRGRKGGVMLARPAADISIGAVVRLTEETLRAAGHDDGGQAAGLEQVLDEAFLAFVEVLDGNTIADLAGTDAGRAEDARPAARRIARRD
jgi:Rrf2 family protein